jgi:carbamoyltransferase
MTTYSDVIDLIMEQNIVAIFQGKSEAGPRALGNRSILFDPRNPKGRDIVNTVKKREFFRPFAASVILEHVHEWFDMKGVMESPFMMYAVDALPRVLDRIPAVLHVDMTCRLQTVTKEQNPHYYALISEFNNRTGVPMLLNTSFNLAGDPLVETVDDAIDTLARSEIEYLYLPEKSELITARNS